MLSRFRKSSAFQFLLPLAIFAAIPVGLWLMRPRPLTGESATQLISNTRAYRQDIIMDQLEFHVSRYNTSDSDVSARWKTLQQNLIANGIPPSHAKGVLELARTRLNGQKWPILAEHGWINNQPVWVIAAGWPEAGAVWMDFPSAAERHEDDIRRYMHNVDVVLISAQTPYRFLNEFGSN